MFGLFRRNLVFFDDFERMAACAVTGAEELYELAREWPEGMEHVARIRDLEHQADAIAHNAFQNLDQMFQTPIRREEIHDLIRTLDSIIGTIQNAAERLQVFHIVAGRPAFTQQAGTLLSASQSVEKVMRILRHNRRLPAPLSEIVAIQERENQANEIQEATMSKAFAKPTDLLELLRWKELHELVVLATDQCEDVGNIVERIAIQNT